MNKAPTTSINVKELNDNDVLFGRGSVCYEYIGNVKFRLLVAKRRKENLQRSSKSAEKKKVAIQIIEEIHDMDPPGRFLEKKESSNEECPVYVEVDEVKAVDKVKQALRFRDQCDQPIKNDNATRPQIETHSKGKEKSPPKERRPSIDIFDVNELLKAAEQQARATPGDANMKGTSSINISLDEIISFSVDTNESMIESINEEIFKRETNSSKAKKQSSKQDNSGIGKQIKSSSTPYDSNLNVSEHVNVDRNALSDSNLTNLTIENIKKMVDIKHKLKESKRPDTSISMDDVTELSVLFDSDITFAVESNDRMAIDSIDENMFAHEENI